MDLLKNDSSLLLFTTYQVSRWSPHFNSCKLRGKECLIMSHQYPLFTVDGIHYHGIKISSVDVSNGIRFSPSVHSFMQAEEHGDQQTITNYKQWIRLETVKAYKTEVKRDIEPFVLELELTNSYIIMRRSILNPIFHPYYIEYGYDKLEFFARLMAYKRGCSMIRLSLGFRYFVLPQDFGIDIPHKRYSCLPLFPQIFLFSSVQAGQGSSYYE